MEPQTQNKSSIGSIIGIIIIITIIILGGLYFWGKRVEESKYKQQVINEVQNQPQDTNIVMNEAAMIKATGSGDDLNSIEIDLGNTKTDNLSAELDQPMQ